MNKIVGGSIIESKKILLKVLPYIASILTGFLFYFIGIKRSEDIKGLFVNISAVFFAIPLIYLFYQLVHNFSQKRLNKEIFDYAKMQIDREILSIINQLHKIVYRIEETNFSAKTVNKFLSLRKDDLKEIFSKNEYLGFQVFKTWEVSEDNLHEILKNSYILERGGNEQIISIILIIKSLRHLQDIQQTKDLYMITERRDTSYKIVSGKELNEKNTKFHDRFLLLKNLGENKFIVADFGDFAVYNINGLLHIFTINKKFLEIYSDAIFDLMSEINNWVDLTGGELVIDTKMFRLGYKVTLNNSKT